MKPWMACLALCVAAATPAFGQPYEISWRTVDGGGSMGVIGGPYVLDSTSGQPDAGPPQTGGTYALAGGFWPGAGAATANQPPVLAAIGNRQVAEGANLTFPVNATDPDPGDTLTYSASGLPPGATFTPATRTFDWTPGFAQAGTWPGVTFTVEDGQGGSDFEAITITVTNTNRPPVLAAIGNRTAGESLLLEFTVSAFDPDSDP